MLVAQPETTDDLLLDRLDGNARRLSGEKSCFVTHCVCGMARGHPAATPRLPQALRALTADDSSDHVPLVQCCAMLGPCLARTGRATEAEKMGSPAPAVPSPCVGSDHRWLHTFGAPDRVPPLPAQDLSDAATQDTGDKFMTYNDERAYHGHPTVENVSLLALPSDYPRIKVVGSLAELVSTPFQDGVNALCWPRTLPGDFREVVEGLGQDEGIVTVDESFLEELSLSEAGQVARDQLLADQRRLRALDLQPNLDCVHGSPREEPEGLFHADVHSFHVDTATVPADTWLCTYVGATSEGLRNDQARRRVDHRQTRDALLRIYGGPDDAGFLEFLAANFYDLHYDPLPGAQPYPFGLGNLWRIAIAYPGCPVPACIHRAPLTLPGQPSRLLLIS